MKVWFALLIGFLLAGCTHEEGYYLKSPKRLQAFLNQCNTNPKNNKVELCASLRAKTELLNKQAYALQTDPQGFGKKILQLQQTIAAQKISPNDSINQEQLSQNQALLKDYLIVVNWLESPEND